ncbi:unnamed protein product, partial [Soboliphyme baturini]|uniref:DUF5641 domain-containing protein n=1 Tax=Soboliphyme baturini TaxID=241478 RepID=A0A183JAC8_9BILA
MEHSSRKKNLLSRLSCSRVKQTLFGKAPSSNVASALHLDGGTHKPFGGLSRRSKSKTNFSTTKTVVEVIREGIVNYVCGRDLDGKNWEKGRMVLVKTVGGYLLEFYSPPKASKPKNGIFCFFISEARETTVLETPYHQSTFVLKVCVMIYVYLEFVITDD